jgi:catechol 2,3-dioxygenase-like lactoylglutathione lyase family enzyme
VHLTRCTASRTDRDGLLAAIEQERTAMNYKLEVIILPVSDVDRTLAFYTENAGFTLDVDNRPTDEFRVVQLTPPGSSCSIQIGVGLTDAAPGSTRGLYTVVEDLQAARDALIDSGVDVSQIRHKSPIDGWRGGWEPGLDPNRGDYASFADFTDPDGNQWVLQERGEQG